MGIIVDGVLVTLLALSIFLGYKRGLVKVVFNLCAVIVAIVITFILYKPVSSFVVENTELDEVIKQAILDRGITQKEMVTVDEGANFEKHIEKYAQDAITDAKNNAVESAADMITLNAVNVIVAIGLFIVVRILLIFAKALAEILAELPIIKQCDKFGGVLYGAIVGLMCIYIILAIAFFVISINRMSEVSDIIASSFITKYLYENNIILTIIH